MCTQLLFGFFPCSNNAQAKYVKGYETLSGGENKPVYYSMDDMVVGTMLVINGHHFKLTEAAPGECLLD